jgi:uncharacterized protein (UPF0303 family)
MSTSLIEAIAHQEKSLVFTKFNESMAWLIGAALHEKAIAESWPIVVDIHLFHRPLFFVALPGSTPNNVEYARRKRNVVERFHRSSYAVGREMVLKGDTLANRYGLPTADYADHGGAFPITVHGCGVVGAIVVSGLPQRDDHMLIVSTLCSVLHQSLESMPLPSE